MTERPLPRSEIDAAIDWTGRPVDCSQCPHRALLEQTGCAPRWSCVQDRYARRIDRFFSMHPQLADDYLSNPYFEVRAVAAKYADLFRLSALLTDPDETVRWSVAMRLPTRQLHKLSRDPDREVRIRVAARIDATHLLQMIHDPDYYVRQIVARRLPASLLHLMTSDPDSEVRKVVATRASGALRVGLARDPDPAVRLVAIEHLPADQLFPCAPMRTGGCAMSWPRACPGRSSGRCSGMKTPKSGSWRGRAGRHLPTTSIRLPAVGELSTSMDELSANVDEPSAYADERSARGGSHHGRRRYR